MTRQAARSTTRFANHSYPSFYACYLLKSLSTTYKGNRSTRYRYFSVSPSLRLYERAILSRTYIGSTPNPPRRIRQHNGEITSGATKTAQGRPWTMQMLVYGFPGRLSALQYEWAFQHPWKARHLKSAGAIFPKTGRTLKHNVECVHLWPFVLGLTIFQQEWLRLWSAHIHTTPWLFTSRYLTMKPINTGMKRARKVHRFHTGSMCPLNWKEWMGNPAAKGQEERSRLM